MSSEQKKKDLLEQIAEAVATYDEDACTHLCKSLLEDGFDPYEGIMQGLAAGMDQVGKLYEEKQYFVPELLLCSDALYAGLDVLRPHVKSKERNERVVKILIGVVEGDIHDIGKNLVKTMFEAAGWEVHDLGKDVKVNRFVEAQQKVMADVVGLSALMTTSMLAMPKIIESLKTQYPDVVIMLGGAPLSPEISQKYGADGYARDAVTAVKEATRLLRE